MKQEITITRKFWQKKISPFYSLFFLLAGISFFACSLINESGRSDNGLTFVQQDCPPSAVTNFRMNNYLFTRPLLLSDGAKESESMHGLKHDIAGLIESKKSSGQLLSAAVHVVSLNDGEWISLNKDERFNPGSLFKVPVVMTFLREAEKNPALMDQKYYLSPSAKVPPQTFNEHYLVPGRSYTIRELMYNMIVKSDNYATLLLNQNVNLDEFGKFFNNIGLPTPDMHDRSYSLSVTEYSKFLRVLYNASYISNEDADYVLSLLVQTTFKEGMTKLLPSDVQVAHKFGEWGEPGAGTVHQLHETGIIYIENTPILVNVMTKGMEVKTLPNVISEITKLVYDRVTTGKVKS
jgi:beta-lactamase class A